MGRASRRKRANGGAGFYRRQHLLAAIGGRDDDVAPHERANTTADSGSERQLTPPQDVDDSVADTDTDDRESDAGLTP
ncbi:MAG: hypothetical protein M3Y74_20185 [Chloroflexota bacterium]|nr:hypothetical protein [Chloroflexota bacterium]